MPCSIAPSMALRHPLAQSPLAKKMRPWGACNAFSCGSGGAEADVGEGFGGTRHDFARVGEQRLDRAVKLHAAFRHLRPMSLPFFVIILPLLLSAIMAGAPARPASVRRNLTSVKIYRDRQQA